MDDVPHMSELRAWLQRVEAQLPPSVSVFHRTYRSDHDV